MAIASVLHFALLLHLESFFFIFLTKLVFSRFYFYISSLTIDLNSLASNFDQRYRGYFLELIVKEAGTGVVESLILSQGARWTNARAQKRVSKSRTVARGFSSGRGSRTQACFPPICKVQLAAVALVKVPYRLATIA